LRPFDAIDKLPQGSEVNEKVPVSLL